MGMYQISYDVKDSKKTDNKVVLTNLVRILKKELKATAIVRPVASMLRFMCDSKRSVVWKAIIAWANENGVWYLASEIVKSEDGKLWRYIESPDESLQRELDEIIESLANEDATV